MTNDWQDALDRMTEEEVEAYFKEVEARLKGTNKEDGVLG